MSHFYCDEGTVRFYAVVVLPVEEHDPPLRRRVHDIDMDPECWYFVEQERLQPTAREALLAAVDALRQRDSERDHEIQNLQRKREATHALLATLEPEKDET